MKKMLLVLGVAAAAMTSCTSDEVLEMNPTNTIKFESFVNKGTRAVTETRTAELTKFYVFGYHDGDASPVFSNNSVTFTDGSWMNESTKYWTANQYYFGAYANKATSDKLDGDPTGEAEASFANNGTLTISNYSVGSNNPENHSTDDLVGAVVAHNNSSLSNATIQFNFQHLLSQVKFEFCNNNQGYYMKVSDILFTAPMKGTCTITNAGNISWTQVGNDMLQYTYPGTAAEVYIATGGSYTSESFLVLPTIAISSKASFTISFYERIGTEGNYTYNLVQTIPYENISLVGTTGPTDNTNDALNNTDVESITSWNSGYIYNYKAYFPVAPSAILFNATVTGWEEDEVNDNTSNDSSVVF